MCSSRVPLRTLRMARSACPSERPPSLHGTQRCSSDFEICGPSAVGGVSREERVLKHAASQGHPPNARPASDPARDLGNHRPDGLVKCRGDVLARSAVGHIPRNLANDRRGVNPPHVRPESRSKRYRRGMSPGSECFELHRRLTLEAGAITKADQGRDRVEEPAHAGRRRRVDAARNHLSRHTQPRRRDAVAEYLTGGPRSGPYAAAKMRDRHAPWFAGGDVATRQWHVREMSGATKCGALDDQELPAPDRAVRHRGRRRRTRRQSPVRCSRARPHRRARGHDGAGPQAPCRWIRRTRIASTGSRDADRARRLPGSMSSRRGQVRRGFAQCQIRRRRFQIADVTGQIRSISGGQAECVLEVPTHRENADRRAFCERERSWRIAAGATHRSTCRPDRHAHDGVIATHVDAAVVREENVRDVAELLEREPRLHRPSAHHFDCRWSSPAAGQRREATDDESACRAAARRTLDSPERRSAPAIRPRVYVPHFGRRARSAARVT